MRIFSNLFVVVLCLCFHYSQGGRITRSEDDFESLENSLDNFDSDFGGPSEGGFFEDDFFGEGEDTFDDPGLPPCDDLAPWELEDPDVLCDNSTTTKEPEEVRIHDQIFEKLIEQIWIDYQTALNNDKGLYGIQLDPLDVDSKLPEPIDLATTGAGYTADIQMSGIKAYGISSIRLRDIAVTRNENLTDLDMALTFEFPSALVLNGTYSLKGSVGWWDLNSNGTQNFDIVIVNATLSLRIKMDLLMPDTYSFVSCDELYNGNVVITRIQMPLNYEDVDFRFQNLGSFANNVVNGIGVYILKTQEEVIVGEIRKTIKREINSLIC
eukprot:TRINITY_DN22105_c0_g1_i1.p1 TRINITY_DN22105_c0_g1~~TRINITY_DN22105_c0_g1_i1.p1  ORF type:complete len:324 (-),score=29.90 TRINITY_DN22105_c0_g1_i1:150-1121(-)